VGSRRVGFVRLGLATLLHCVSAEKQEIAGRAKIKSLRVGL